MNSSLPRYTPALIGLLLGAVLSELTTLAVTAIVMGAIIVGYLIVWFADWLLERNFHPGCPGIEPPSRRSDLIWNLSDWCREKITGREWLGP